MTYSTRSSIKVLTDSDTKSWRTPRTSPDPPARGLPLGSDSTQPRYREAPKSLGRARPRHWVQWDPHSSRGNLVVQEQVDDFND